MKSLALLLGTAALLLLPQAHAQTWPDRPIRFIVPFDAGGPTDITARRFANVVSASLKQQIIVINRVGASGIVGTDTVVKAAPDGYTIVIAAQSTGVLNPFLFAKHPYDVLKDLQPITLLVRYPYFLGVSTKLPINNFKDYLNLAKSRPEGLMYGSAGSGTTTNLAMKKLGALVNLKLTEVPYKSNAQVANAVMAGDIDSYLAGPDGMMLGIPSGRIRAIGVAAAKRAPAFPVVPTFAEQGVANFEVSSWFGVLTTAGVPMPIVNRLNEEFNKALKDPELQKYMASISLEPVGGSAASFGEFLAVEHKTWGPVIKEIGLAGSLGK